MHSFLDSVVTHLNTLPSDNFERLTIILPSQRAGIFLQKKLVHSLTGKTSILPEIISIETFIENLSGLESIDSNTALLLFYEAYLSQCPEKERKDFDSFASWGQTLLQDFNEIDRYLVNHNSFFKYLYYINDQKHWFLQENKTQLVENYIQFWERLQLYYKAFTSKLIDLGKGYQGLQYRKAAEHIKEFSSNTKNTFLFVGFNALNVAEQQIIQTLITDNKATAIWDADTAFFYDRDHDASHFLRVINKQWKVETKILKNLHNSYAQPKNFIINGVPKNIGQVKYVAQLLSEKTADQLAKTALVLADESLLLPILNSLPENVQNVNITMGLSLNQLPMAAFINQFIESKLTYSSGNGFYYKELIAILQNKITKLLLGNSVCSTIYYTITKNNYVYVTKSMIREAINSKANKIIDLLFSNYTNNKNFLNELIEITTLYINKNIESENSIQISQSQKYLDILLELADLAEQFPYVETLKTLQYLLKDKLSSESIDFRGEPFQGLQIMGVLESRCLDFETVIMTSVNEGTLPSGSKGNSFIPYDLKIDTGLPTYKEKDAIYAYHFYRLLQRCNTAHLLYNTQVDELNSGEKSRFLQQLELERQPNHTVTSSVISTNSEVNYTPIEFVDKDESVLKKLTSIAEKGFSPSALGSYLRNPLGFYEQYILEVRDSDEVEEEVAQNTMGTIIHNVLEKFYKPLEKRIVAAHDIQLMQKNTTKAVENEFNNVYSNIQIKNGINYITVQAAKEYILRFLRLEKQQIEAGNEIHIIAIESKIKTKIKISELNFPVAIAGKVDRVDRYNGQLRIVDYKTGSVSAADLKIRNWDKLIADDKRSKALQILMYAYMFCIENNITTPVHGGIISFKKLKEEFFPFEKYIAEKGNKSEPDITKEIFDAFLIQLRQLITEICDISVPFEKKEIKTFFK